MKEGISIVMAYHSRRIQLSRTLSSITKSKYDSLSAISNTIYNIFSKILIKKLRLSKDDLKN